MNAKACSMLCRCSSFMAKTRNRFYEEARAVYKPADMVYNIYLDKHCLKTPKRKPVEISSEALALAVAQEWNMQKKMLNPSLMRLTSLIFTSIDNPMLLKKSDVVSQVLEFLDKDTILYRLEENKKLFELQKKNWDPVIEFVNWEYGLSVKPSFSLVEEAVVDEVSRSRLVNHFSDYSFLQLTGLHYATESIKSVLLTLATISCHLDVDKAVELTMLEQKYQTDIWGKVKWAHDIEREELTSRLAAGVLLVQLADAETEKKKESLKLNDGVKSGLKM